MGLDRSMGSLFTVAGEKMGYTVTDAERLKHLMGEGMEFSPEKLRFSVKKSDH